MRPVRLVASTVLLVAAGVLPAATPALADSRDVTVVGINDFHGRLLPSASTGEAGGAVMVGKINELRAANPHLVFAAAGDLIGASTFESFVQQDKPTIDLFNEAGLDVSAAGNHEFDQGYDDLVNRVLAPFDAVTNPYGGAKWQYLAANVRKKSDNSHALPDRWIKTVNGVKVGFVGAVTEELPSLVNPDRISSIAVTGIVNEVNASADVLESEGADVIVMLVHEGAATTDISSVTDDSTFGRIVKGVDGSVDAIISGHTHLAYDHRVTVPEWQAEGRPVTARPVVSAGQYGVNINKLDLTVSVDPDNDPTTHDSQITDIKSAIVPLYQSAPADAAAQKIVDDARAEADTLGARKLGRLRNGFVRAQLSNGAENRGGESTLGNLVAEIYRWATQDEVFGGAQIGFVNPGGLRTDMLGSNSGGYPADLTYKQAAVVQPFANTLVTMRMSGDLLKTLLEQQWQRTPSGEVPARPFLRLGTSRGFHYTYDPARAEGDRITGMWLNGQRISPSQTYSVATNAFLAAGGDNFRAFGQATNKRDSGQIDLQATVAYAASESPLTADWTQHAVGISGMKDRYEYGEALKVAVSSWAFSGVNDVRDTSIEARIGDVVLGQFPVDNTTGTSPFDEYGTALIDTPIPAGVSGGQRTLTLTGDKTGTRIGLPVTVAKRAATVAASVTPGTVAFKQQSSAIDVTVTAAGTAPTGTVVALRDGRPVGAGELVGGKAVLDVGPFSAVGVMPLTVKYTGDETTQTATAPVDITVVKARPRIKVLSPKKVGGKVSRLVSVTNPHFTVAGSVRAKVIGRKTADTARLRGGIATLNLGQLPSGKHTIKYTYLGSPDVTKESVKRVVRVKR